MNTKNRLSTAFLRMAVLSLLAWVLTAAMLAFAAEDSPPNVATTLTGTDSAACPAETDCVLRGEPEAKDSENCADQTGVLSGTATEESQKTHAPADSNVSVNSDTASEVPDSSTASSEADEPESPQAPADSEDPSDSDTPSEVPDSSTASNEADEPESPQAPADSEDLSDSDTSSEVPDSPTAPDEADEPESPQAPADSENPSISDDADASADPPLPEENLPETSANNIYKITLDINGGTSETTSVSTNEYGEISSLPLPMREGYTFIGWFFGRGDSERVVKYTIFTQDTTIYAHWQEAEPEQPEEPEHPTITLTLNANGGSAEISTVEIEANGTVLSLPVPTRDGYTFTGWFLGTEDSERVSKNTVFTQDTTIYAHWQEAEPEQPEEPEHPTFTLTLNANGGSAEISTVETEANGTVLSLPVPTRDGYTFTGWFLGTEDSERVSKNTVFTQDTTIYAHWQEAEPEQPEEPEHPTFTLTLNANGGSAEISTVETEANGTVLSLPVPTRDGYTFTGWFLGTEDSERVSKNTIFTQDTTIYAHWEEDTPDEPDPPVPPEKPRFQITLDANGGFSETGRVQTDENGRLTDMLPIPLREKYIFEGWFLDKESENPRPVRPDTIFTQDATIYALWQPAPPEPPVEPRPEQPDASTPSAPADPTPPTAEELEQQNWKVTEPATDTSAPAYTYTAPDGTLLTGSQRIRDANGVSRLYLFNDTGILQTGTNIALATDDGLHDEGDIFLDGKFYYLNPDRDPADPRTCYIMTDYLRIRDRYAGQTYYASDGTPSEGWLKNDTGQLRYQTHISQPEENLDVYLMVWRAQELPACWHPDHPNDPDYFLAAGKYFFDDEGMLTETEGWHDGKDGREYYTDSSGRIIQERSCQTALSLDG